MNQRTRLLSAGLLVTAAVVAVLLSGAFPLRFAAEHHGDTEIDIRVQARETNDGRVEVRAQSNIAGGEWMTHTPQARLLPAEADPGRWYSSSSFVIGVPAAASEGPDPASYTQTFVERAISLYEQEGLTATVEHYNLPESAEGQWYVFIMDEDDVFIAHRNQELVGQADDDVEGPDGYPVGRMVRAAATEAGAWVDYQFDNPALGRAQLKHSWVVRHDGLIFGSGWYEDVPSRVDAPGAYTQSFVERALELYGVLGRDAALEYYNTAESADGEWYVFIMDEDDVLVANQNQDIVGIPSADVNGPDGYPAGRMVVAVASEDGGWVDYQFNNPALGRAQLKHSWVVRHDGLIFGSGWYEDPPSKVHAPGAYTQSYVERALELYRVLGREATLEFYNSRDSADEQWYMFIHETDGTRVAHAYRSGLEGWLGSSVSVDGVDVTGYDYGSSILAIEHSGWVSYVFVNPEDENRYQRKHSWIVTHDGLRFGSGWYDRNYDLASEDPAGYSRVLVQEAIDRYKAEGREATLEHHNSLESVDGEWYVFIFEPDGTRLAHPFLPAGENIFDGGPDVTGYNFSADFVAVEDREWVSYVYVNPETGEQEQKHTWIVKHDGLLFAAGWYEAGAYQAPDS
jgi:hypothetical protein